MSQAVGFSSSIPVDLSLNRKGPLSSIFHDLEKRMAELVDRTQGAADEVIMRAAEEMLNAIGTLKDAYIDSLNKTYEEVDQAIKQNIDRIDRVVSDIIKQEAGALSDLGGEIQEIVDSSILGRWWVPRLNKIEPQFVTVSDKPYSTGMTVQGHFPYADQYRPSLEIGGKAGILDQNNDKRLDFQITIDPASVIPTDSYYSLIRGSLKVDWKKNWLPWFGWTVSTYRVSLHVIPKIAATVDVVYKKCPPPSTQSYTSQRVTVPAGHHREETTPYTFALSAEEIKAGWRFDLQSPIGCPITNVQGPNDFFVFITEKKPTYIVVSCRRRHSAADIQVFATKIKEEPEEVSTRALNGQLEWGANVIVIPEKYESIQSLTCRFFNKTESSFLPEAQRTQFLQFSNINQNLTIKVKSIDELTSADFRRVQRKERFLEDKKE